ncbi:hypothetical protein [Sphingorhabdus sp.]|jgi:hypothetical protein|uniref:hypothetical protein n=1 Tax=Sphingorhabdus sp. TaxID=1902408 RepID=UPI0037CA21EC
MKQISYWLNVRTFKQPNYLVAFGYIGDHWQGRLQLRLSFWVSGLFAALFVAELSIFAIDEIYQSDLSEKAWLVSMLIVLGLSIAISAWAIIGILLRRLLFYQAN